MTAVVDVVEHTARGPQAASEIMLLALDAPSIEFPVDPARWDWPLRAPSDGTAALSCERWLQVRFRPSYRRITRCRFWIEGYAPNPGWTVLYGLSDTYRKPSTSRSAIAVNELPAADPAIPNLNPATIVGPLTSTSPFLVLQAEWLGGPGFIQAVAPQITIAWDET